MELVSCKDCVHKTPDGYCDIPLTDLQLQITYFMQCPQKPFYCGQYEEKEV